MRHVVLVLSAATVLALAPSATLAASPHHHRHHVSARVMRRAPAHAGYDGHPYNYGSVNSTGPIYRDGYYLGSDPDPNVRFELIRDPWYARQRW
jgi:hypothetical protein